MSWALTQQIVENPAARHVLLCLANYADQNGRSAFPSVSTLVIDTGLSERSVRSKLEHLENLGVITRGNQKVVVAYIDRPDRRPVCYDIVMNLAEKRGANGAGRSEIPVDNSVNEILRGANGAGTGCISFHNGVQMVQERGAGGAPNTSLNPLTKPSIDPIASSAKAIAIPEPVDNFFKTDFYLTALQQHRPDLVVQAEFIKASFKIYFNDLGRPRNDWANQWLNWILKERI